MVKHKKLAGSPYVGLSPNINILDPAALAFRHRYSLFLLGFRTLLAQKINIRDPPGLALGHGSESVVILHHGGIKNKSALVGNRWRTPPGSSDTDPDPWSPLQAPLDPIALPGTCPSTNQAEGVTKDLDPVRKHLEESSRQFRQGLTCF